MIKGIGHPYNFSSSGMIGHLLRILKVLKEGKLIILIIRVKG